jgi:hypothetical protein
VKNSYALTFGIIKNDRSWSFSAKKCWLYAHWSLTGGSYFLPNTCFLAIDLRWEAQIPYPTHISLPITSLLGFLCRPFIREKFIFVNLWYYRKRSFMVVFGKKVSVICPLIFNGKILFLAQHMFFCHKSDSWTFGGDQFFVKKSLVLALILPKQSFITIFEEKYRPYAHCSLMGGS